MLTLQGLRHGDAMGVGSFGQVAAVLFGIALTIGPFSTVSEPSHVSGFAGVVIAFHAGVAVTAFVLLLAWASFG